jgi:hypothetical protein
LLLVFLREVGRLLLLLNFSTLYVLVETLFSPGFEKILREVRNIMTSVFNL